MTIAYQVSTKTSNADPGSGNMKFNTATQSDATQLYLSNIAADSTDVSSTLASLVPGNTLDIQNNIDTAIHGTYIVDLVTANAGWFMINVTPGVSTGLPFPSNQNVVIDINTGPSSSATLYEYRVVDVPTATGAIDLEKTLDWYGNEGWYLVGTGIWTSTTIRFCFIRNKHP